MEDLSFTFDTSFFDKGIKKVSSGLQGVKTTAGDVAKGVSRGLTSMALKIGAVFAGFKGIQTALRNMPEVGEAFGIAKDIFLKNLLYPLRQQVFPLLQKMLDWVRENRTTFVRWGQTLANVFRAVVSGVKNVISFIKSVTVQIGEFAQRIFGDRIRNINDLFNIIAFKVSATIEFLTLLISNVKGVFSGVAPYFDNIVKNLVGMGTSIADFVQGILTANKEGHSLGTLLEKIGGMFGGIVEFITSIGDSFFKGLTPKLSEMMTPLTNIADAFKRIFDAVFGTTEQLTFWKPLFEGIGKFIGDVLMFALNGVADAISLIADGIEAIKKFEFPKFDNPLEKLGAFFKGEKVDDAIIKPDGSIIRTAPDDTLIATKNPVTMATTTNKQESKNVSISIPTTVYVESGTKEEGANIANGIMEQLEIQFNREFERGGL